MGLTGLGPKTKRCIDRSLCKGETTRTVVVTQNVELVMNSGQLAVNFKIRWVQLQRLVQEIGCFEELLFSTLAVSRAQKKVPGPRVEIEGRNVSRGHTLNRGFFGVR